MAIFKHVIQGKFAAGEVWTTGFKSQGDGGVIEAHLTFVNQFLLPVFSANLLLPMLPPEVSLTGSATYLLNTVTGKATAVSRTSNNGTGTATGDAMPYRDSVVAGLRTLTPGPSGRGRMYFPCVSEASVNDGFLAQQTASEIANGLAAALDDLATSGFQPVVWKPPSSTGLNIETVTVSLTPGTQRRRTNKIPPNYQQGILAGGVLRRV